MREKRWIDCPVCGTAKSMRRKKQVLQRLQPKGYPPLCIEALDGQFCAVCGEGFLSLRSEKRFTQAIAEHMAKFDATLTVAADLVSVKEAAAAMKVSVQGVHKMMKEGRLRFVYAGGMRLPIREDLMERVKQQQIAAPEKPRGRARAR